MIIEEKVTKPTTMEVEVLRVQNVASQAKETIPDMFIRSEIEQPGITTVQGTQLEVPVIDFSDPDEGKVLKEIMEASRDWGIFQIVNHEIPSKLIGKLQAAGKEFFELPQEEKEQYAKPPGSQSLEGYGTKLQKEVDGKKGWVDHFFHKLWPPSDINYSFWPKNPPCYRLLFEEYVISFIFFSYLLYPPFCMHTAQFHEHCNFLIEGETISTLNCLFTIIVENYKMK